jgi:hypothetical protein
MYPKMYSEMLFVCPDVVYADQIQEIVIAALSVASATAACVLLLLNICIKHQRPVLSLLAVLFTFVSGNSG